MSSMINWRPHTTGMLVGGVVAVVIAVAVSFMLTHFQPKVELRLGSSVFHTRVAKDDVSRQKGLSGQESLKPNEGLLMVYASDGRWGIWMKDMKFPIDIIWLDEKKKVVHIVMNAPETDQATTYSPKEKARYVLELPAGTVQASNIKVGQLAVFTISPDGVQ